MSVCFSPPSTHMRASFWRLAGSGGCSQCRRCETPCREAGRSASGVLHVVFLPYTAVRGMDTPGSPFYHGTCCGEPIPTRRVAARKHHADSILAYVNTFV